MRLALAFLLAAGSAEAQPMTAEEFEAWSTGRTLDYYVDGVYWGSEQHLQGRRTLDADADGPCRDGRWFALPEMICFLYESEPGEHCWRFRREGSAVLADLVGEPAGGPRITVIPRDEPLACAGPDVGV